VKWCKTAHEKANPTMNSLSERGRCIVTGEERRDGQWNRNGRLRTMDSNGLPAFARPSATGKRVWVWICVARSYLHVSDVARKEVITIYSSQPMQPMSLQPVLRQPYSPPHKDHLTHQPFRTPQISNSF